jgi:polyhydroxyalkanoate synthase
VLDALFARGERRARIEANRALLRFVNGIDWLIRDPKTVVGRTPYDVVLKQDKLEVRRYHAGSVRPRYDVPVMLVPPLMVKPFIFDLMPGRSLAAFLLQEGFRVYLVDFGEPDDADAYITLDDYVLDWIPMACDAVKEDARSAELSLLGYCMGGLFSLSYVATTGDSSVRNIVSIAAPVDTRKMGLFAWLAKMAGGQVEFITNRLGNVPGGLSSTVFRLLTPMKNVTRYTDLFMNMWNREYVNGFDAMNQWVGQFIDYPQAAFEQFTHEFMQHNKLVRGKMKFGNKLADLKRVTASLLVFAGRSDQIAPMAAVEAVLETVSSDDTEFRAVPGGHMGVFAGAAAEERVWAPAAQWLAPRSRAAVAAPRTAKPRKAKPRKAAQRGRSSTRKKAAASA